MTDKRGSVPENILGLLSAADQRHGFPNGTMASMMQQEVGGNVDQYLADPSKYHYEAGADGQRIAGRTGKVSTAFGPFGLLESTAADPGYGVKPLGDKSLAEQVRFASDYLAARSKSGGGLSAGLAGYGEGSKYAGQVTARLGKGVIAANDAATPTPAPGAPAAAIVAPEAPPMTVAVAQPAVAPIQTVAPGQVAPDAWQEFLRTMPQGGGGQRPVAAADLNYGQPMVQAPMQMAVAAPQSLTPNFQAFSSWHRRAA